MFSKVFIALALAFGLALNVQAHALIAPAIGVTGTGVRSDVKRPTNARPCGNVNIANSLASSTAVSANADGSFSMTITNFNRGRDGSRQVTATVDSTATGDNFVAATVTQNGDRAPTSTGTQDLTIELPAGTQCTGGTGNQCLVSFKTAGNFGNCVLVEQGAAAAAAGNSTTDATADTTTDTTTDGTTDTTTGKTKKGKRAFDVRAVGTRAAMAIRRAVEGDEDFDDFEEEPEVL